VSAFDILLQMAKFHGKIGLVTIYYHSPGSRNNPQVLPQNQFVAIADFRNIHLSQWTTDIDKFL
jgi:hypothetical protein